MKTAAESPDKNSLKSPEAPQEKTDLQVNGVHILWLNNLQPQW